MGNGQLWNHRQCCGDREIGKKIDELLQFSKFAKVFFTTKVFTVPYCLFCGRTALPNVGVENEIQNSIQTQSLMLEICPEHYKLAIAIGYSYVAAQIFESLQWCRFI